MDIWNVFIDMQATGERIKQLRKERDIKVFDLANALGLESEQAIYKWQRGQCLPSADNLVRLSILSGCHIEDILIHNTTEEDESPLLPFIGYRQNRSNQIMNGGLVFFMLLLKWVRGAEIVGDPTSSIFLENWHYVDHLLNDKFNDTIKLHI